MFEREIKFIYDFNLNKVKKTGSFLTYEQLLAADLHPAIMQYISAEIDYLIFEDRQKMLKNSVFDYSGGKITHYFNLISREVKKSKRFSTEYISKLILHASSFTVNFLIRPNWSLLKFIYDEEEHKTSAEIKQILNYLYYYGYLKNVLISYFDKKKILSMNKDEFAELLDKIEKLGVETYLDDVINTALKSMAEFFNIGSTQKNKVPLPGIQIFLKEKKLTEHLNILTESFGNDEKINYEIKDLQKLLIGVSKKENDEFEELVEEEIENTQQRLDDEIIETQEEETAAAEPAEKDVEVDNEIEIKQSRKVREETPNIDNFEPEVQEEKAAAEDEMIEGHIEEEQLENAAEEPLEKVNDEEKSEKDSAINDGVNETAEEGINEINETGVEDLNEQEKTEENILAEEEIEDEEIERDKVYKEDGTQSLEEILEEKIESRDEEENKAEEQEIIENEIEEEPSEAEDQIEEEEPSLFGKEDFKDDEAEPEDEKTGTDEPEVQNEGVDAATVIDMSEILEHKNMTKIIENIFDYDMEEFANTVDMISECPSKAEALALLNELFENNNIKSNSKEAETFKSIISEYFDKA